MKINTYRDELILGGLNDTLDPERRAENQFKQLTNWDISPQGNLVKSKGRGYWGNNPNNPSLTPTTLIVPPSDMPLAVLNSENNKLRIAVDNSGNITYYLISLATGKYYEYTDLASALQTAINNALGENAVEIVFEETLSRYLFTSLTSKKIILHWGHPSTTLDSNLFGCSYSLTIPPFLVNNLEDPAANNLYGGTGSVNRVKYGCFFSLYSDCYISKIKVKIGAFSTDGVFPSSSEYTTMRLCYAIWDSQNAMYVAQYGDNEYIAEANETNYYYPNIPATPYTTICTFTFGERGVFMKKGIFKVTGPPGGGDYIVPSFYVYRKNWTPTCKGGYLIAHSNNTNTWGGCWHYLSSNQYVYFDVFRPVSCHIFVSCISAELPPPPPYNRFVSYLNGSFYKVSSDGEDFIEIKLRDGSSLKQSDNRWAGVWHNKRWYGSNGKESLILRNNKYLSYMLDNDLAIPHSLKAVQYNSYYETTQAPPLVISLDKDTPLARLKLPKSYETINNQNYLFYPVIETLKLKLGRQADTNRPNASEFRAEIYVENLKENYRYLLHTIEADEITPNSGVETYTIEKCWIPYFVSSETEEDSYLLIKFCPYSDSTTQMLQIGVFSETSSPNVFKIDAKGEFQLLNYKYWAQMTLNTFDEDTKKFNFKVSLINAEGYESQLNQYALTKTFTNLSGKSISLTIWALKDSLKYDWEWVRVYRTTDKGETYYKVIDIPRSLMQERGSGSSKYLEITIRVGLKDKDLVSHPEADITPRQPPPPFKYADWWMERMFFAGVEDSPDVLYFTEPNQPENINLAYNYIKIGKAKEEITGFLSSEDRMLIFTPFGSEVVLAQGSSFAKPEEYIQSSVGLASHYSIQSVRFEEGSGYFFQGSDGHFYFSDGVNLLSISKGRLDEIIKSLNKNALDKTISFIKNDTQDIVWLVCSGTSQFPNLQLIFNTKYKCWRTKTFGASCVAYDKINSNYSNQILILGGLQNTGRLFYFDLADADLGQSINAILETADLTLQAPHIYKEFISFLLNVRPSSSQQSLALEWYLNKSNNPRYTTTIPLNTSTQYYKKALIGLGDTIRFKITNTDNLGPIYISSYDIYWVPVYRS